MNLGCDALSHRDRRDEVAANDGKARTRKAGSRDIYCSRARVCNGQALCGVGTYGDIAEAHARCARGEDARTLSPCGGGGGRVPRTTGKAKGYQRQGKKRQGINTAIMSAGVCQSLHYSPTILVMGLGVCRSHGRESRDRHRAATTGQRNGRGAGAFACTNGHLSTCTSVGDRQVTCE